MIYSRSFLHVRQALIMVVLVLAPNSTPGQDNTPVPSEAAQQQALGLIKEVYGDEWKNAETSAQKQALATKLLKAAGESTDNNNRYALLKVARDVATQAGDAELAFKAIDAMTSRYDVDTYKLKGTALSQAAKSAESQKHSTAIAERALVLFDQAVVKDDFVVAKYLGKLALDAARKGRDGQLVKRVVARNKEVEELAEAYAQVAHALVTLKEIPDHPEANLAVGKYHCFVRGDWDRGLPKLALGSDEPLKKLAMMELGDMTGPAERVALGDGWWDLASANEKAVRERILERAVFWYRKALPWVSGLVKDKVEKRIGESTNVRSNSHIVKHVPGGAPSSDGDISGRWTQRPQFGERKGRVTQVFELQRDGNMTVTSTVAGDKSMGRWLRVNNVLRLLFQDGSQKTCLITSESKNVMSILVEGKRPYRWERVR